MLVERFRQAGIFLLTLGATFAIEGSGHAKDFAVSEGEEKVASEDVETRKLALLRGPINPLKGKASGVKVRHATILMVGDTGYAPHGARPHPKGVGKHGRWLTFSEATQKIRSEINADINFANIETVISDGVGLRSMPKKYNFVTHPNSARHLVDVGFNLFSLANNHSYDFRAEGVVQTLDHSKALLSHGLLAYAGTGRTNAEAAKVPVFSVEGIRFGFGAIGIGASSGGIQRATANRPGQLNIRSKSDLALLADNLSQSNSEFRILSVHQGPERYIRPSEHEAASVRQQMLEPGNVDLLIGHHAHVTRGLELNNGRLVVWGLGNFLHHGTANMAKFGGCKNYSIMVKAHVVAMGEAKPEIAAIEVFPITQTHIQTVRLGPQQSAKKIGIINGLAAQFDAPNQGRQGVRFATRADGSGLYCRPGADAHSETRALCAGWQPVLKAAAHNRALSTCGGSVRGPQVIAKAAPSEPAVSKASHAPSSKKKVVAQKVRKGGDKARTLRGKNNTVIVVGHETYAQKRARWKKKQYTAAEVAAWKRHVRQKKARRSKKRRRRG